MKTALVTGGNRGLGFEIAKGLVKDGFKVFITSRSFSDAERAAKDIDVGVFPLEVEIEKEKTIERAVKILSSQTDHLDVLVNNAGIMGSTPLRDWDVEEFENVWRVNVLGPLKMVRQLYPLLRKADHPKILNMSSGMGEQAGVEQGGYPAYRQSKWALNGLTMQLNADLEDKFFVASMCPGWCQTDMGGSGAPRSAEQGADTAVWLASASALPSGKFWRDRNQIEW